MGSAMIEGLRKGLECQVRDLQTSLEEAEAIALRSGKKLVAKMEVRIRDLENDLNTEAKRHSETMNNAIRHERRAKELELQTEEDQKNIQLKTSSLLSVAGLDFHSDPHPSCTRISFHLSSTSCDSFWPWTSSASPATDLPCAHGCTFSSSTH